MIERQNDVNGRNITSRLRINSFALEIIFYIFQLHIETFNQKLNWNSGAAPEPTVSFVKGFCYKLSIARTCLSIFRPKSIILSWITSIPVINYLFKIKIHIHLRWNVSQCFDVALSNIRWAYSWKEKKLSEQRRRKSQALELFRMSFIYEEFVKLFSSSWISREYKSLYSDLHRRNNLKDYESV